MWVIMPQTVKVRGVEIEVECKLVRYAPPQLSKKTGEMTFPHLANPVWRLLVANTTWGSAMSEPIRITRGKTGINVRYPDRRVKKDPDNPIGKEYVIKPNSGEATGTMGDQRAEAYLQERFGVDFAAVILGTLLDAANGNPAACAA